MMQIGTIGRVGTARPTGRAAEAAARQTTEPSRALVALDGGRAEARPSEPDHDAQRRRTRGGTRPLAGFLTQMIVDADPTLRPSRLERTGIATACYAETARLTA